MSRVNTNIASLLSRRVIEIKNQSVGPSAYLRARCEVQCSEFDGDTNHRIELRTSDFELLSEIAHENVMAAESAIYDGEFAFEASSLNSVRILVERNSRPRASNQTIGCDPLLTSI